MEAKSLGNGIQAGGIKTYKKFQVELKQIEIRNLDAYWLNQFV